VEFLGNWVNTRGPKICSGDGLDGIMLPKSEKKEEITKVDHFLKKEEEKKKLKPNSISVMPLLESPRGVSNASEIATASKRIAALALELGTFYENWVKGSLLHDSPRTNISHDFIRPFKDLNCSTSCWCPAIDTPFFGLLIDTDGLVRESSELSY